VIGVGGVRVIVKTTNLAEEDIKFTWRDSVGAVIDFAAGFTFELKVGSVSNAAELTKTTGITGATTAPNITIVFTADELAGVPVGLRTAQLRARQTAGNKDRYLYFWLHVLDTVD
jgi:hypothetical protein